MPYRLVKIVDAGEVSKIFISQFLSDKRKKIICMRTYRAKDITDIHLIIQAIYMAFKGKWHRTETRRILRKCDGNTTDEKCAHLAKSIQQTIIQMDREPDVYKVSERMDANTRKIRQIASTSVYSQIYHWLLVLACQDIFMKQIYVHQCASIPKRGGTYGKKFVERWLQNDKKNTKYCLKIDFKKCYQHIQPGIVMKLLRSKIRDKNVLWLAETILYSYDDGLPIGSVTSQWLCNFVISYICHYLKETLSVEYCIFYMADGCIFGNNKKKLHKIKRKLDEYCASFGLVIKDNWQVFRVDYIDKKESARMGKTIHKGRFVDFMGYKFYRDHTEIRRATSLRIRRKFKKARKRIQNKEQLSSRLCAGCLSYMGAIKHTDSFHFYNKYIKDVDLNILKGVIRNNENGKQYQTGRGCNRKNWNRNVRSNSQHKYPGS